MKTSHAFLIASAATLLSSHARATLVYDGFAGYTADATVVGQGPATTGFTGNWGNNGGALVAGTVDIATRASGLSYAGYAPNSSGLLEGYRATGSHSGTAKSVTRNFSGYTVSETEDLYFAFLFAGTSTSDDGSSEFRFVAGTNTDNNRDTRLQFNHNTGTLTLTAGGGAAVPYNEAALPGTNLLVIRAMTDASVGNPNPAFYDAIQIWINPTISDMPTFTAADFGAPDASSFGIMRDFTGAGALAHNRFQFLHTLDNGNLQVDELVVTHDLSDIVAIPEPGTLALLGIAIGSLLFFRRR